MNVGLCANEVHVSISLGGQHVARFNTGCLVCAVYCAPNELSFCCFLILQKENKLQVIV